MTARVKKDFTAGPIFMPMMAFVLPIILTNILQTFYAIADNIVVGKFSGDLLALAAVGSSGALSALFSGIPLGLSAGAAVAISQYFGAKDYEKVSRGVHTAVSFSLIFGIALWAVAFIFTEDMLILMDTKPELLDAACTYLHIVFAGLPAVSIYNFAASSLRAVGDSRTSLYILSLSGLLNVALNLLFVLGFGMSADGVALATAISQYASAIAVIAVLAVRRDTVYALHFKKLTISKPILARMLRFGVPNSIQNSMFSISNVLLTTAVNTLDTYALSARTIAMNLTALLNNVASSYTNATLTFAAQNYGARNAGRIKKTLFIGLLQSCVITLFAGILCFMFIEPISDFYIAAEDAGRDAIIGYTREVCIVTLPLYSICSIMNVLSGSLRGVGYSLYPMFISIFGICGFRIIWIYTAFNIPALHSLWGLYLSYPISWLIVILGLVVVLLSTWGRMKEKLRHRS